MPKPELDPAREERIEMEIVVDAYDEVERAIGWYCHLENAMSFPFRARCTVERATSALDVGDEVEVLEMAQEEECEHEMLVNVRWKKRRLAVPLAQLTALNADEDTLEAVEDWHYWTRMGYQF